MGARQRSTGDGSTLLVKEGRKSPFVIMPRELLVPVTLQKNDLLTKLSILAQ